MDTLEIKLESYAGSLWARVLLPALGTPSGTYRFVGVAHSEDARWPTYRIPGDTFPLDRVFPADVPPPDQWPSEMTNSLAHLRIGLANHGWLPTGRGNDPWSYHYIRPCVETPPTDEPDSPTP